jgi:hypothetical protein
MTSNHIISIALLFVIHLVSGISAAGIDLAIANMAMKLAPKNEAISYISARNIIVAIFAAAGPIAGGLMADFFAAHQLTWNVQWHGPTGISTLNLLELQNWNFFFAISAILALLSMRLVKRIKEQGEVHKGMVTIVMKKSVTRGIRRNISGEALKDRINNPVIMPALKKRMITYKLWKEVKNTA